MTVDQRSVDGTAYDFIGTDDAPVVVLIHGLGLCRRLWDEHLDAFSQKYRVLTYDLYGHGESVPAPQTASLEIFSDQLLRLMDELEIDTASAVGFSIGGMINRRFALDHGDRLSALVILNSPHDRGAEAQKQVEGRAATVRDQGAFATFDAALERWFTHEFRTNNPMVMQLVRDWRGAVDGESYAQTAWVLAAGITELIKPNPPVETPCLIMTCENDSGSTPAMSYEIANEIDGADVLIVPQLQHLGLMEKPALFTKPVADFLERVLP